MAESGKGSSPREGWASRIISRSLVAGGIGAGAGFLLGRPALRLGASVSTNFIVAASRFCGKQGIAPWMGGVRYIRQHTKHKVILTAPFERLGQAGQIVNVAPGFARNRLFPNKLALPAIEKFVLLVQNQVQLAGIAQVEEAVQAPKTEQEIEAEKLKVIDDVLHRLAKGRVVIRRDVGMKTTLLKLVTKSDILHEVQRQLGVELREENVVMETDFSQLGDFDLLLRLPEGLKLPGDKAKMFLKIRIRRK